MNWRYRVAIAILAVACERGPAGREKATQPPASGRSVPPVPAPVEPAPVKPTEAAEPIDPKVDLPELAATGDARCGKIAARGRSALDVVSGRLRIDVPRGAADIPKSYDVMGAPEPTEHESRVILEQSKTKFVIYAREMFQTAPADLGAASIGYFTAYHRRDKDAFEFGKVPVADPDLRVVAAKPVKLVTDDGGDAILILASLVRTSDNTLLAVDFYVNPALAKVAASCQRYAIELARSLHHGKPLDLAGGEKTIASMGVQLAVDVPAGYTLTTQDGPDFQVHYLRKLAPLGAYPGHLLIYLGGHPDTTVPTGAGSAVKRKGKLLGTATEWGGWRSATGGVVLATVPIKAGGHEQIQVVQVASLDGAYLDELDRIASSIRVR